MVYPEEVMLWRAVLQRAIADALGQDQAGMTEKVAQRIRSHARAWIVGNTDDFRRVCDWGCVDSGWIIRKFLELEESRGGQPAPGKKVEIAA